MSQLLLTKTPHESIENKGYVKSCFNAMGLISDNMNWVANFKDEDQEIDDISRIYERNYIITLVSNLYKAGFKTLGLIGGEVAKSFDIGLNKSYADLYADIKKKINNSYNRRPSIVFPDFLIHESHNYNNLSRRDQHFIIEAKTNRIERKEYFFLDFLKLNYYLENLAYDNAAYLILNNKITDLQFFLDSYSEEVVYYHNSIFNNLYFFIQERYQDKPQIYMITNNS